MNKITVLFLVPPITDNLSYINSRMFRHRSYSEEDEYWYNKKCDWEESCCEVEEYEEL